ncbi:MAG: hypothetical protein M3P97_07000 [Actinomycetota bacterium]|nr:hypothetical protein [Actinomycetota bacterium]
MADNDNDPTTVTRAGRTQPMPAAAPRGPEPGRAPGWRSGQVAVVGILALLLGGAGATLAWFATDRGDPEPSGAALSTTTSTTTASSDAAGSSSITTSSSTSTTARSGGSGNQSETGQRQGETRVGNSIFTATYQSNSDRSTEDFEVGDDWRIRWDVPEGAVTIEVFDVNDVPVETIEARGRGEFVRGEGGTYRLDIDTDGARYTVVVTDGP